MTSNLGKYLDENSAVDKDISTCLRRIVRGIASYVKVKLTEDQRGLSSDEREDIDRFLLQSPGAYQPLVMSECFSEALQIVEALGDSDDPLDHDLLIKLLFGNDLPLDESPIAIRFNAVTDWLERLANSEKLRDHQLLYRIISKQDSQGETVLHNHTVFDARLASWLLKLDEQDETRELLYKTLSTKNARGESFYRTESMGDRLQSFLPVFERLISAEDLSEDMVDEICHDEKLLSVKVNELKAVIPLLLKMVSSKFERHRAFLEKVLSQQVDGQDLVFSPDHFKIVLPVLLKLVMSKDPAHRNLFFDVVSRLSPTATSPLIYEHLGAFYPLLKALSQNQNDNDRLFLYRLYGIKDSDGQTLKEIMSRSMIYKL
jgi:hypothetical protein